MGAVAVMEKVAALAARVSRGWGCWAGERAVLEVGVG